MAQVWHDLLFAHWPIDPETMRGRLPRAFELDTLDGKAWLGVVPFRMSGVRLRGHPLFAGSRRSPNSSENVCQARGEPGVWFFSLDAADPLVVAVARAWFRLPYFRARMSCTRDGDDVVYASVRTHAGAPGAELAGRYGPRGEVLPARPGTLEHWLTERYCLYALSRHSGVLRAEIHHRPWPLQPAEAVFEPNTMAGRTGSSSPQRAAPPLRATPGCRRVGTAAPGAQPWSAAGRYDLMLWTHREALGVPEGSGRRGGQACSSTTSPSASGCSLSDLLSVESGGAQTHAYGTERARSLCTSRATSCPVWPRRRAKGRSRLGGWPGTMV